MALLEVRFCNLPREAEENHEKFRLVGVLGVEHGTIQRNATHYTAIFGGELRAGVLTLLLLLGVYTKTEAKFLFPNSDEIEQS